MARLNKEKKIQIIENAVKASGIEKEVEKLVARRAEFAEQLRLRAMGGQSNIDLFVKNSVTGALHSNTEVRFISNKKERHSLCFHGRMGRWNSLRKYSSEPDVKSYPVPQGYFPLTAAEQKKYSAIEKEESRLHEKLSSIIQAVKPVVFSVTTEKRLIEVWPESAELIPKSEEDTTKNLPALPIKEINLLVGLPTDK
jgi:hypothetical protein